MAVCCATVVDPKKQNYNNIIFGPKNLFLCCSNQMIDPRKLQQNSKNVCFMVFLVKTNFVESSLFFGSTTKFWANLGPKFPKSGPRFATPKQQNCTPIALSKGRTSQITPKLPPQMGGSSPNCPPNARKTSQFTPKLLFKWEEDQPNYPPNGGEDQPKCPPNCPKLPK